jgi:hypothetical protein
MNAQDYYYYLALVSSSDERREPGHINNQALRSTVGKRIYYVRLQAHASSIKNYSI